MSYMNDNKNKIACFAEEMGKKGFNFNGENVARCINCNPALDYNCWRELASLIKPYIDIDDVNNWSLWELQDCKDELKRMLFSDIQSAILNYYSELQKKKETNNGQVD